VDAIGYLNDRPADRQGPMPNAESIAELDCETKVSAKKLARFFTEQYEGGLSARRRHALAWIKVTSIMAGVHYFKMVKGTYKAIEPKEGEVRAHIPIMDWLWRWELGRFNSNEIGVSAYPVSAENSDSFYQAARAQAIMDAWIDEAEIPDFYDESNQHLCFYGRSGYLRYIDQAARQVRLTSLPSPEIFPIPYDARNVSQCTGLMRVALVSRDWLAMQDDIYRRKYGREPDPKMEDQAGRYSTDLRPSYAGFGSNVQTGANMDGAVAMWIWMKPTEENPFGQHALIINETLFRYVSGTDAQGRLLALPGGRIPIELVDYDKHPNSFWPHGFCEKLIAMQREINRQWSDTIMSAKWNRPITAYNEEWFKCVDIGSTINGLVPFRDIGETKNPPMYRFNAGSLGHEVGAILQIAQRTAEQAGGYESGIPFGRQEGRTEGGPATSLLNSNSKAAVQPVFNRQHRAFKRTFPMVLDELRLVWPQDKIIRVVGAQNMGREIAISNGGIPWSKDVILEPLPLMANGRNEQYAQLWQMRASPTQDGTGFLMSDREFRNGLSKIRMAPPGMELENRAERRILWRIEQLIGDGQNPRIPPVGIDPRNGQSTAPEQDMENHAVAIEMLKDRILDPSFRIYSAAVKQALMTELQFHIQRIAGVHPDNFDQDIQEADARRAEAFLEAAELDPSTTEGEMVLDGLFMQ